MALKDRIKFFFRELFMSILSGITIVFILFIVAWAALHKLWPELRSAATQGWEGMDIYGMSEGKFKRIQAEVERLLDSEKLTEPE